MAKRIRKSKNPNLKKQLGQIPGAIVYTGVKEQQELFIESFDFNLENVEEKELKDITESFVFRDSSSITWLNINGLNHVETIEAVGDHYDIHPLVLEDIVSINQRPKIDEYDNYLFVVLKMLYYKDNKELISEQVSFVLGKNYVISFQESEGDVFDSVRQRIRTGKGRIRHLGSDYLLYTLIDAIVDNYFTVAEVLSDKIEFLENQLFDGKSNDHLNVEIQDLKREVLKVRRAIFPLREIANRIEKHESSLILKKTKTFYRDIYDHIIQVSENIDIYREMIWSLMDMYMTTINNKMNEVMKTLTIMASIFIPLTFIAGIYGMNFENIPELKYKYAYYVLIAIMLVIAGFMVYYFKKKKWF